MATRTVMRLPAVGTFVRDGRWILVTRYTSGLFVHDRRGAAGRPVPQPWFLDAGGDRVRLDDAMGAGWRVLALDGGRSAADWEGVGVPAVRVLPPGSTPTLGAVVDIDGVLGAWLGRYKAQAVALRPDGFVYAAAHEGGKLPSPPLRARQTWSGSATLRHHDDAQHPRAVDAVDAH